MHFLEITCAYIVFKFCRYTHKRINWERGAMTFKGGPKGTKQGHAPKAPENGKNRLILRYNKKAKHLLFISFIFHYLLSRKQVKSDYFSYIEMSP